jgi:acyl-CoA reductase-like NAD-dependent aldehyde dehydrogenase
MTTAVEAISTPLLIGGQERPGGAGTFPVYDPGQTGAIIGYAAAASAADALAAVDAAEAAWPAWAALSAAERVAITLKALEGLETDQDARTDVLSRENGKIRFEAFIDLAVFSGRFHQAAQYAPELDVDEHIQGPPFSTTISKLPRGIVTIIYPFNWPLAILAASLPAALMSGNTVIAKPPPTTPLSSAQTLGHLVRSLPPGVLNVVTGADEVVGPIVVGDPRIRHVCFTGSVGGGKRIMAMAAANLTNVTLELGGNDPAVVLEDAVLDADAFGKMSGATFMTTGQVCMALKRLYVPRSRYDEVVDGLKATLVNQKVGPGLDPATTMGPLNTARQRDYVAGLLEQAKAAGAEVQTYGEYTGDWASGNYMLPSLVLDPAPDLGIVTEEQFGPTVPVLPYDDEEQVIRLANARDGRPVRAARALNQNP